MFDGELIQKPVILVDQFHRQGHRWPSFIAKFHHDDQGTDLPFSRLMALIIGLFYGKVYTKAPCLAVKPTVSGQDLPNKTYPIHSTFMVVPSIFIHIVGHSFQKCLKMVDIFGGLL